MKKSSDDRPTKQQKRPTHEDIPDVRTRTAVQQAYDNERANPGGWKEWHARNDMRISDHRVPVEDAQSSCNYLSECVLNIYRVGCSVDL